MPSIKQIQNRLSIKKNSLSKVNLDLTKAGKNNNTVGSRKLHQEMVTIERDIRKLERQLIMEKKGSMVR